MSDPPNILAAKEALRARIRAWRAELSAEAQTQAAEAVARHGLDFLQPQPTKGSTVAGFSPLPDEFRIWPLLRRLAADGLPLALPVMQSKTEPLLFRAWSPGDVMDRAVWGIAEPKADRPALEPDILIVPLLAFDRVGWRLGYGGGYYDRTLKSLRARKEIVAVGLGFDEQAVDAVPHLDYDQRLDWVLCPSGPIRCKG